jgi:cytochrome c-type protein NapB
MNATRWYYIILTGGFTLALVGFFVGTRQDEYTGVKETGYVDAPEDETSSDSGTRSARKYPELMEEPFRNNRQWQTALYEDQRYLDLDSPPAKQEPRAANRAYAGAPPTVPHTIQQRGDLGCASCHLNGQQIQDRVAPAMSHRFMQNCTQCHAPSEPKLPFETQRPETISGTNHFDGMQQTERGEREYAGSPPQMPHPIYMRQNCLSCHGPARTNAVTTTHPERRVCTQCHIPTDKWDFQPTQGFGYLKEPRAK